MGWEIVVGKGASASFMKVGDDEVSIVSTKSGKSEMYRINMQKSLFKEGTRQVKLMIDKEKGKVGFFVAPPGELEHKGLSNYGTKSKSVLVYVTMKKKIMEDMGFTKGRYKLLGKGKEEGMYFYISAKKPVEVKQVENETAATE